MDFDDNMSLFSNGTYKTSKTNGFCFKNDQNNKMRINDNYSIYDANDDRMSLRSA